jgi:hypothetical protein
MDGHSIMADEANSLFWQFCGSTYNLYTLLQKRLAPAANDGLRVCTGTLLIFLPENKILPSELIKCTL